MDKYTTIIADVTDPIRRHDAEKEINKLYEEGHTPHEFLTTKGILVATLLKFEPRPAVALPPVWEIYTSKKAEEEK